MGSKPKPTVVHQDPEGDARRAAEKATAEANTKKAMRRSGAAGGTSVLGGKGGNQQRSNIWSAPSEKKSKLGGG